jgi:hypothetical protein
MQKEENIQTILKALVNQVTGKNKTLKRIHYVYS